MEMASARSAASAPMTMMRERSVAAASPRTRPSTFTRPSCPAEDQLGSSPAHCGSRPSRIAGAYARRLLELTLLRTGLIDLPRSTFFPDGGAEIVRIPVWSGLLRTDQGLVLFDTGLHPVHVDRPDATYGPQSTVKPVMGREDAIVSRLAAVGVRPDDVAVVVNSHLHFDHAGNNGAFPEATFVVQADHLAFAKGNPRVPGVYW